MAAAAETQAGRCLAPLLLILCVAAAAGANGGDGDWSDLPAPALGRAEIQALKDEVVEMFAHTYDSYMAHAFPLDELRPISCVGVVSDATPSGGG
jgi:mannosidase alpha-like ER degradation enhancer 2